MLPVDTVLDILNQRGVLPFLERANIKLIVPKTVYSKFCDDQILFTFKEDKPFLPQFINYTRSKEFQLYGVRDFLQARVEDDRMQSDYATYFSRYVVECVDPYGSYILEQVFFEMFIDWLLCKKIIVSETEFKEDEIIVKLEFCDKVSDFFNAYWKVFSIYDATYSRQDYKRILTLRYSEWINWQIKTYKITLDGHMLETYQKLKKDIYMQ